MLLSKEELAKIGTYKELTDIQLLFNAHNWLKEHFNYTSESTQYPKEVEIIWDIWRPVLRRLKDNNITLVGDCDDFMLQLITILYQCGYPLKRLWLTCVHAYTGEGHAVPLIETGQGIFQADNMLKAPIPAFWGFNGVGYYTSKYCEDIMNCGDDAGQWYKFEPLNTLPKPKELL